MADAWAEATKKLIQLTEKGDVVWKPDDSLSARRRTRFPLVGPVYRTETNGKSIAIFEARDVAWDDDGGLTPFTESNAIIEFVDSTGEPEWTWPSSPARFELLDAVRYQQSKARTFLESFLSSAS